MFCLRVSSLKLTQRFPYSQVTAITSTSLYRFDNDGKQFSRSNFGYRLHPKALGCYDGSDLTAKQYCTKTDKLSLHGVLYKIQCTLKEIQLKELCKAPPPIFWYSMAGLVPFWIPPLAVLVSGFSPAMATAQLVYGALINSFIGGVRWGVAMNDPPKMEPSWTNIMWSVVPLLFGWFSLLLPEKIGFALLGTGLALSAYMDMTSPFFPVWYRALRIVLTASALLAVFLMFLIRLFH